MDERAQTLLKALIERYISDGQPVGSRTLSRNVGIDLSPATIRNVMSDLEDMGLIVSPHTSAGRVPTPKGYRFFVDSLLTVEPISLQDAGVLKGQLNTDEPQRLMSSAAGLLSTLSHFAGVIMTPKPASTFSQIEFLRLSGRRVLVIIVTPDGDIQNRILQPEREHSATELVEAANYINRHFAGMDFGQIRARLHTELSQLREDIAALMRSALEAGTNAVASDPEPILVSGERNLLDVADLSQDIDRLRALFDVFDKRAMLAQLLDASSQAGGVQIYIGGESSLVPMEQLSVVTAAYEVDGRIVGTLGVVGPTRMAYDRVIPIVDITAKLLSGVLSQSHSPTQVSLPIGRGMGKQE